VRRVELSLGLLYQSIDRSYIHTYIHSSIHPFIHSLRMDCLISVGARRLKRCWRWDESTVQHPTTKEERNTSREARQVHREGGTRTYKKDPGDSVREEEARLHSV
jgi:hypothetical protein